MSISMCLGKMIFTSFDLSSKLCS